MKQIRIKGFVITILFLSFICANIRIQKQQTIPEINKVFPLKFSQWQGKELIPDEAVYEMLDKSEFLFRQYKNLQNGKEYSLAIVLTGKRDHIHDPNICYTGQGISMKKVTEKEISENLNVSYILGEKSQTPYSLVYWYTDLKNSYTRRREFMNKISLAKFFDLPTKGFALVVIISPEEKGTKDILKFAQEVHEILKGI